MVDDLKFVIEQAREFALSEIQNYSLPPKINFETSNVKGQELARLLNADADIVMLGTILMDIKLGQSKAEGRQKEHTKLGAKAAEEFLSQFELPSEVIAKVVNCVAAHHKEIPFFCKEAEICANADCYNFINPRNVFAFIGFKARSGMPIDQAMELAYKKLEEKHQILSLDICKKELEPYYVTFKELFEASKKNELIKHD